MSLFDVLRYPISDYPTAEVLDNLPDELFKEWVSLSDFAGNCEDKVYIAGWYRRYFGTRNFTNTDFNDVNLLRKMIKEYDEPI